MTSILDNKYVWKGLFITQFYVVFLRNWRKPWYIWIFFWVPKFRSEKRSPYNMPQVAQRRRKDRVLPMLIVEARRGWWFNATSRLLDPRYRDSVPIVQEAGWARGSVWTSVKNIAHAGVSNPGPSIAHSPVTNFDAVQTHIWIWDPSSVNTECCAAGINVQQELFGLKTQ